MNFHGHLVNQVPELKQPYETSSMLEFLPETETFAMGPLDATIAVAGQHCPPLDRDIGKLDPGLMR